MNTKALFLVFLLSSAAVIDATSPFAYSALASRTLRRIFRPSPFSLRPRLFGGGGRMLLGAKHLLLAPITIPVAIAGKALGAGMIAGPAMVGAALGAPIGAFGGAVAGAATGAAKGALVGKAILLSKVALAAKAVKLAAVPFVIAHKAHKLILIKKIALGVHAMKISGKVLKKVGIAKIKAATALKAYKKKLVAKIAKAATTRQAPAPEPQPQQQQERVEPSPPVLDGQFVLNTPLTGSRFARIHVTGN